MRSIEALKEFNLVCWSVLFIGLQRGWANKSDISDYAISQLYTGLDNGDKNIAVLASSSTLDRSEIEDLLLQVGGGIKSTESIEKWRLAKLIVLSKSSFSEEEKLNKLQKIYAEFDYPKDMASCSIYSQDSIDPLLAMSEVITALTKKFTDWSCYSAEDSECNT